MLLMSVAFASILSARRLSGRGSQEEQRPSQNPSVSATAAPIAPQECRVVHINDSCSPTLSFACHSEQGRARRHLRRDAASSNGSALGLVTRPCHAGRAPTCGQRRHYRRGIRMVAVRVKAGNQVVGLPQLDRIAIRIMRPSETPVRAFLRIDANLDRRSGNLSHHRVEITETEIQHPLLRSVAEVINPSPWKWREHDRTALL
jgi:hypothetical protein